LKYDERVSSCRRDVRRDIVGRDRSDVKVTYIVWLFASVLTAKVGVVAVAVRVAILEPSKSY
jgi:hypothetical protein